VSETDEPLLLVLGAGRHQAPLIARAEARGIRTVALDPYPDAPGKRLASIAVLGDAFDPAQVLDVARTHQVDGLTTVGTDQPVLVMAKVAAELGLPCHLTPEGALRATNKAAMGPALVAAGVPMPEAVTIRTSEDWSAIELPARPCVVKAADSQGQRGMTVVGVSDDIERAVESAAAMSRTSTVVVERFHGGPEFTINAWIDDGRAAVALVLDRITVNPPPAIGICLQHVYPSVHESDHVELTAIAEKVAGAYGLRRGPLYIQAIATDEGYKVLEAASRVGGGHEAQLFPRLLGLDLIDRTIDLALGLPEAEFQLRPGAASGLVNFVVARPGVICELTDFDSLIDAKAIDSGGWYVEPGHRQGEIVDSMGRIGFFIVTAPTRADTLHRAQRAYSRLVANDATNRNLVYWPSDDVINRPSS
jgi:biotin carboxylase